jgi:quercetin dioxygenase-like cupin family protein
MSLMTEPASKGLSASGASISAAKNNVLLNQLEQELVKHFPPAKTHSEHRFTPGLYSRETFMPAGSVITSKIHKTEHQFVVLSGRCRVYNSEDNSFVELSAGYVGITKPGTRRVLAIIEDCRWLTFHPTEETEMEAIEAALIEPHDIPAYTKLIEE